MAMTTNYTTHQSDNYRALDQKCKLAAGWDPIKGDWEDREPNALTIRVKESGVVVTIGYEPARERVITAKADLVE